MPGDDARNGNRIEVADSRAHPSGGVDDIAVLETSVLLCESIFDVKSHPVSPCRHAVDKEHDAKGNGVDDREANCKPNAPVPLPRVRASEEATVKEENGYFGTSATDQEGELGEPHAQHGVRSQFGLDVPDVTAAICLLCVNDRDGREHQGSDPGREKNALLLSV